LDKRITVTGTFGKDAANIEESRRLVTMRLKVAISQGIK
jgi:hypothetical protein